MTQNYRNTPRSSDLHRLAEALWEERSPFRRGPGCGDPHALIQELGVQRFELELKNGDLAAAYDELWRALERYTELYDFAPVAYLTLLTNGRISEANFAAATLFGLERSKLIGASILDYIEADHLPSFQALLLEIGRTPSPVRPSEIGIHQANGTRLQVRLHGIGGDFVPAHGRNVKLAMIDLTEREQARTALQAERDQAMACFDAAAVFMLVLDPAGLILRINRKGLALLRYDHERELIGRNWFTDCLPERGNSRSRDRFLEMVAGGGDRPRHHKGQILCRDGSQQVLAFRDSLLRDARSQVLGIVSVGEEPRHRALHARPERHQAEARISR